MRGGWIFDKDEARTPDRNSGTVTRAWTWHMVVTLRWKPSSQKNGRTNGWTQFQAPLILPAIFIDRLWKPSLDGLGRYIGRQWQTAERRLHVLLPGIRDSDKDLRPSQQPPRKRLPLGSQRRWAWSPCLKNDTDSHSTSPLTLRCATMKCIWRELICGGGGWGARWTLGHLGPC